jgi:hypothetical protein
LIVAVATLSVVLVDVSVTALVGSATAGASGSIGQEEPVAGSVTTAASASFTDALATNGSGVTFTVTKTSGAGLLVSSSGKITTSGELAAATYAISGTDSDSSGDTGTWGFILTVNPVTITQGAPIASSVTTTTSANFADTLVTSGSGVTFGPVSSGGLLVSSSGKVTTIGKLAAGTYTIVGSDSDGFGDTGSWGFILTVDPVTIAQAIPLAGSVVETQSAAFTGTLVTSGSGVTFSPVSSGGLLVSASGKVATTGKLAVGTYTISGTDWDGFGDSGSWYFTLTVTPAAATGGPPRTVRVQPQVFVTVVGSWTVSANETVHLRVHLYGSRGTVSGVVRLDLAGKTLCVLTLERGIGRCTVSSSEIGRGRHGLVVVYEGSGFYRAYRHLANVYVH